MDIITSPVEDGAAAWLILVAFVGLAGLTIGLLVRRNRRAEDLLRRNADLIGHLNEGVYRSTPGGQQISANAALVRLNGYSSEAEQVASVGDIGAEWYVDPKRREQFQAIIHRDGSIENFVSEIYRHKTRERIWISESARLVRDPKSSAPLYYEGSVRDVTEAVKGQQLTAQFQKLTSQVPGGLFQFCRHADGTFSVAYLSAGWEELTGVRARSDASCDYDFRSGIWPDDLVEYDRLLKESGDNLTRWVCDFRYRTPAGDEKWLHISAQPEAEDDKITWHGRISDISKRKQYEQEIAELAFFDPLTRLPNRRNLLDRMAECMHACAANQQLGALLFVDLDNFKSLNDSQGHDKGDIFLIEAAQRLRASVTADDIVARIGGDEFVVLLRSAGENVSVATRHAMAVARDIVDAMRPGFNLGKLRHFSSASVGVAVFDGSEAGAGEILKRADIAMYQVKVAGRNGAALFDPVEVDRQSTRYRLANDLGAALAENQLELYFQPQIGSDGVVCGAEALLRWQHPTFGQILPDRFVPLAEQFGLAADLQKFVLAKALEAMNGWSQHKRTARLQLAVNVSSQLLSHDDFVPMVREMVEASGVDATLLTLELTETVMAKNQLRVGERMRALKMLGVRLSLDDFGTGYSSLAYLKRLPIDEIKIDGSFVADIETDENDRALVKAIIAIAQSLDLMTVAEHVESAHQEMFLRALGCNVFQGHRYSPAVPIEQFNAILAAAIPADAAGQPQHAMRASA